MVRIQIKNAAFLWQFFLFQYYFPCGQKKEKKHKKKDKEE